MDSKIGIIVAREFRERVMKKSFLVTTILVPIFMIACMTLPALLMIFTSSEERVIAVVDDSGLVAQHLKSTDELKYEIEFNGVDSARNRDDVFAVLHINKDVVLRPGGVKVYTNDAMTMTVESLLRHTISEVVRDERLKSYNIDNIDKILADADVSVDLQVFKNKQVDEESDNEADSALVSYMIGFILSFTLYMLMLLYGQLVMTSIVEEKGNRVLELMVSSVKPFQLMTGKILGVGLVAITQMLIWCVVTMIISTVITPLLIPADVMGEVAQYQAGSLADANMDIDMLQALSVLGNIGYMARLLGYAMLYLIGGYMLYSSIFAAIGSAVENIQDASQLSTLATMPIIIGFFIEFACINEPTSSLATWSSMIPFFSPMVMVVRLPFGVPDWQVIISLVILFASSLGMVWMAAKIYRVGIFMYGKKPSIKELAKWITYK